MDDEEDEDDFNGDTEKDDDKIYSLSPLSFGSNLEREEALKRFEDVFDFGDGNGFDDSGLLVIFGGIILDVSFDSTPTGSDPRVRRLRKKRKKRSHDEAAARTGPIPTMVPVEGDGASTALTATWRAAAGAT